MHLFIIRMGEVVGSSCISAQSIRFTDFDQKIVIEFVEMAGLSVLNANNKYPIALIECVERRPFNLRCMVMLVFQR